MRWTSIVAIYALFWVMCTFIALSFGVRTSVESGEELVPGQAHSAPADFRPRRVMLRGTILATILFGLYYANWVNGWITLDTIDIVDPLLFGGKS